MPRIRAEQPVEEDRGDRVIALFLRAVMADVVPPQPPEQPRPQRQLVAGVMDRIVHHIADAEAEASRKEARVWINGIRAVDRVIGVKVVYDLSATPFFLRGSGQEEGKLFPWVA